MNTDSSLWDFVFCLKLSGGGWCKALSSQIDVSLVNAISRILSSNQRGQSWLKVLLKFEDDQDWALSRALW